MLAYSASTRLRIAQHGRLFRVHGRTKCLLQRSLRLVRLHLPSYVPMTSLILTRKNAATLIEGPSDARMLFGSLDISCTITTGFAFCTGERGFPITSQELDLGPDVDPSAPRVVIHTHDDRSIASTQQSVVEKEGDHDMTEG